MANPRIRQISELSEAERAQLLGSYADGQSVAALAGQYRVNSITLLQWLLPSTRARPEVPHTTMRKLPYAVQAALLERYGLGEDPRVLAAEHGLNPASIINYANKRGVQRRSLVPGRTRPHRAGDSR